MFERYTEKARRVIFFSRYEASQFGSPQIETEHLLLGILREDKALAFRLMKASGGLKDIVAEIEKHSVYREQVPTSVDMQLSPECRRVLAHAAEEADRLKQAQIAVEHLLLGLLREEQSFAAELLHKRGMRLSAAREMIRMATPVTAPPAPAAAPAPEAEAPELHDFGVSLLQQAEGGLLPQLIGREHELQRTIQILCRLTRANPVLVGEPGVGRRSIVYGLAHRICEGSVPARLQNSRVISLDLAVLASGIKPRSRFEQNLEKILDQLREPAGVLFFVEGFHSFTETQSFASVVNIMKPALQGASIRCISTATPAEYRKGIETAPWLGELFTIVEVRPATETEALNVLRGSKERFEKFHGVTYTDESLQYAVFHANSYFPDRYLPEKAIDLIDEAGTLASFYASKLPDDVLEIQKRMKLINHRMEAAIAGHEFEKARFDSEELQKERTNLKKMKEKYKIEDRPATITREDIERVVAQRTGVSIDLLRRSRAPYGPGPQTP